MKKIETKNEMIGFLAFSNETKRSIQNVLSA